MNHLRAELKISVLFLFFLFKGIIGFGQTDEIDSLIQALPNKKGEEKIYLLSDISYFLSGKDNKKSLYYAKLCLQEAQKSKNKKWIAEGHNAMAIAFYTSSQFQNAISENEEALAIRIKLKDDQGILSSYSKIANCYSDLGEYSKSIEYNLKALRIAEKNDWNAYSGLLLSNIGVIYKEQRKFEKALSYYTKAISIAKKDSDTLAWARALNNSGVVYKELNQKAKAKTAYLKSLELLEGRSQVDVEAGVLLNLGALEASNGKQDLALVYYKRALPMAEEANDLHNLAILYTNIGNRLLELNKLDSAGYFIQKSVQLARDLGLKKQEADGRQGLARYYTQVGNFKEAYFEELIADSLQNELLGVENAKVVEELNLKYETEKRNKKLAQQKISLARKDSRFQRFVLLAVISTLVVFILFVWFVQRQKRLKQGLSLEREKAKTRLQDEKLRISRELHDNIGAQLTFFISSLESTEKRSEDEKVRDGIKTVRQHAKQTMNELREAIWTIQSDEVSYQELVAKVAGFVQQLKSNELSIVVENKLELAEAERNFSPEEAIALFRILQEALNNAVKHAEARTIKLIFQAGYILVSDNGKGFVESELLGGYGLVNMKARASQHGFKFEISSSTNGTELKISEL